MKRSFLIISFIISILLLCSCLRVQPHGNTETAVSAETTRPEESSSDAEPAGQTDTEVHAEEPDYCVTVSTFDISSIDIPAYSGSPNSEINGGVPFFSQEEITDEFFIELSELDELGRCGSNIMCADEEHIQTGERDWIRFIHPSGWHSNSIYQRSHLLMWKLSGCDDEHNLITGTETFNQEGMLEYEERVTAYLWRHAGAHVMYRVTPLFKENELVARGVLMEALSVEDGGQGLSFCMFIYNVEPDYKIDYSTGDYTEG